MKSKRTRFSAHTGATLSLSLRTVFVFHGRRQPSFDVEQRPFACHMLPNSPQQKFVVDIVKGSGDTLPISAIIRIM
jgi:hypothetical protein